MRKEILLRNYQREAVTESLDMIAPESQSGSGIVILPTGSGKSLVAAKTMINSNIKWGMKPLLLTHRKELIAQDEAAIKQINPFISTGVYCAGLGRKEAGADIVLGTIGSVHKKPGLFSDRNLILIDESHLIPRKASTMYGKVIKGQFKNAKRIGLTATPYRLDSGMLTEGNDALFDEILIQVTARELVEAGYLTPLVGVGADVGLIDTSGVHKRMGDFVNSELEQAAMNEEIIKGAAGEIMRLGANRKCHLIFCVSVDHAIAVAVELSSRGWETLPVWGNMPKDDRTEAIDALKAGEIRAITNVDVLTTGVDIPRLDCGSMLRPTMSKARHVQALGRFMRLFDGKDNSLILDFSGNCKRHGDIDDMGMDDFKDLKEEREAEELKQKERDYQEALEEARSASRLPHDIQAANVDPMTGGVTRELDVYDVRYKAQESRRNYRVKNVMVTYITNEGPVNKWLCVEQKKARYYANRWFALRGVKKDDVPHAAFDAMMLARTLENPISISTVKNATGFDDILVEHFRGTDDNGEVVD